MNNKNSIVGVVGAVAISIVALVVAVNAPEATPQGQDQDQVGGERGGVQEFFDGAILGDKNVINKKLTITDSNQQVTYRNTSGKTERVFIADAKLSGTASATTFTAYIATSTSASVVNPYGIASSTVSYKTNFRGLQLFPAAVVNVGTGTADKLFSLRNHALLFTRTETRVGNQTMATASSSKPTYIDLANDEYLIFGLIAPKNCVGGSDTTVKGNSGKCESATSTTNGLEPTLDLWIARDK